MSNVQEVTGEGQQDGANTNVTAIALSTAYKFDGWRMRINAIILFVVAAAFAFTGFVISLVFRTWIGLALVSPIAFGCILGAIYYWKRAKSLVRGKFD